MEIPTLLPPLKGSTAGVACGYLHTLALEYGGNVQSWGANQVGLALLCCLPCGGVLWACRLGGGGDLLGGEPSNQHGMAPSALCDSQQPTLPCRLPLSTCPQQNGVLGLGHEKDQQPRRPSRVRGLSDVRQISAGWKHNAAVTDGGLLYTWGWGGSQGGCCRAGWTEVGDAKNSRQPSAAGT